MKKKVIIISSIVLLLGIIMTILIIFNFFKEVTTVINLANNLKFEYGEEVYLYDTISIYDGNILTQNYLIDTMDLGTKEIEIEYKDSNRWKHKYKYNIEIVDNIAPLLSISSNIYLEVGNKIDSALAGAFWGDNCDRDLSVVVDGEYDLNTVGNYPVTIIASDDSKNETKRSSTIHVYERKDNGNSNNNNSNNKNNQKAGIDINYFFQNYKTDETEIGLDLSEFQVVSDFNLIKQAGIDFVILRIGWGPNEDLSVNDDKNFEDFYKRAKEAGLKVGAYFFSYSNKIEEVDTEINYVLEKLRGKEIDLFVSYDWENWKLFKNANMNFTDLNKMAEKFIIAMNNNGYKGMNYGSKSYLEAIWDIDKYDTWLAHYNKETTYSRPFKIWQISDEGSVPGINGLVDVNILFK